MVTVRRRSRLSASIQDELVKYFVAGSTARAAALLTGVNRHTATLFFHKLRELIAQRLDEEASDLLVGEVEVDESYFGGYRKGIEDSLADQKPQRYRNALEKIQQRRRHPRDANR